MTNLVISTCYTVTIYTIINILNIFIDHVGDGHKHYRMAITSVLYNACLRRRCLTKKGNVAQVEFYNTLCTVTLVSEFTDSLRQMKLVFLLSSVFPKTHKCTFTTFYFTFSYSSSNSLQFDIYFIRVIFQTHKVMCS